MPSGIVRPAHLNRNQEREIADISHTTVYRLFKQYHVRTRTYHPKGRSDGILYRRQEAKTANWVWHMDFAGPWKDSSGVTRSLLLVFDSYSRTILYLGIVEDQKSETVENILSDLFDLYGKARVIITDNGRAFAPSIEGSAHRFPRFWRKMVSNTGGQNHIIPKPTEKPKPPQKTVERGIYPSFRTNT